MKKTILLIAIIIMLSACVSSQQRLETTAGTSNTVRTDAEPTDMIPAYRPSLGGTLGTANPNAYFTISLGEPDISF